MFMVWVCLAVGGLEVLTGAFGYSGATTIFQQIEGAVIGCFGILTITVSWAASAIVTAIKERSSS